MIPEEKLKQLRKSLKRGIPEGEIKEELKKEGYSDEDINNVFIPQKYDMRSWYLTFACIFLLIGLYVLVNGKNWLILIFSALMFAQYGREVKRKNKEGDIS
ncbi:MAG: hypothetical protein QM764_14355 [Chitinophagaceae bacterium]